MRLRSIAFLVATGALFFSLLGFSQAQAAIPGANVDEQRPDKVLFERATWAMETSKYAEARSLLETLIDSHPNSDYVALAKLSIGDAWYAEGSFKKAEDEYRDFVTFFPNRPEAATAQHKIDSIQAKLSKRK